jgi:hypothetical protein
LNNTGPTRSRPGALILAALGVTAFILLTQVIRYPSDVQDLVNGDFVPGARLTYPALYSVFAPLFQMADHVNLLSIKQLIILLVWLNAFWIVMRLSAVMRSEFRWFTVPLELIRFVTFNSAVVIVLTGVLLVDRPKASLFMEDSDYLVLDLHAHTRYSWDGRKKTTLGERVSRHTRGGYDAFFITDHNTTIAYWEADRIYERRKDNATAIPLRGEEVSLWRSHWIVLGPRTTRPAKNLKNLDRIMDFITTIDQSAQNLIIASLPEWWFYHKGNLESFVQAGMEGIEVANGAPKALDFTVEDREEIVRFARKNKLVMSGVTDDHGYGSADYVWNIMYLPDWQTLNNHELERAITDRLHTLRSDALIIVSRIKAEPTRNAFLMGIDPIRQVWEMALSLPLIHAVSFIAWAWVPVLVPLILRTFRTSMD